MHRNPYRSPGSDSIFFKMQQSAFRELWNHDVIFSKKYTIQNKWTFLIHYSNVGVIGKNVINIPLSLHSQAAVSEDTSVLRAIVTNVGILLTAQEVEISGHSPMQLDIDIVF